MIRDHYLLHRYLKDIHLCQQWAPTLSTFVCWYLSTTFLISNESILFLFYVIWNTCKQNNNPFNAIKKGSETHLCGRNIIGNLIMGFVCFEGIVRNKAMTIFRSLNSENWLHFCNCLVPNVTNVVVLIKLNIPLFLKIWNVLFFI